MNTRPRLLVSLLVLALALVPYAAVAAEGDVIQLGIVTDVHVHDTNSPNEHKVMVNYAERVSLFVDAMNAWPADAVIQLGDFVNGAFVMGADLGDPARIPGLLDLGLAALNAFAGPIHHVIGNHDVYDLSKEAILAATGAESAVYSFDLGAFHVIVLDAQFNKDGEDYGHIGWMVQGMIPAAQLEWLRQDLAASDKPTLVCIHQPLDVAFSLTAGGPPVFNRLEVQETLAADGDVIAVFQGHTHDFSVNTIDGIHYVTFAAMVDHDEPTPATWAAVTLDATARTIRIDGEGLNEDHELAF